jgi:uncharacterized phage infection (PIP) family protein YhgE
LVETESRRLQSSTFVDSEAEVSKIVFKAVRDALNQEVMKILGELEKQLTAVLRGVDLRYSGVQTTQSTSCLPDDASCKIKRDLKQLFVYLQRVLMINVTQDLCRRLSKRFSESMKVTTQSDAERQRLQDKILEYEKKIHELSASMSEGESRIEKSEEDQRGTNDSLGSLTEHVKNLLELNHNATDLLEYVSKKFLDVREENMKLKEIPAGKTG